MAEHHDDPAKWPRLGRAFNWVDQPGNGTKIALALAGLCTLTLLLPLVLGHPAHEGPVHGFGVYGAMGFVFFTALILLAKYLRAPIKRPEDYYSPKAVDTEAYPPEELGRVDNDA